MLGSSDCRCKLPFIMKQIRENVFQLTFEELGRPEEKGAYDVENLGTVYLDVADMRYITEHTALGHEPVFFVSRSPAMGNNFVVVSRNRAA